METTTERGEIEKQNFSRKSHQSTKTDDYDKNPNKNVYCLFKLYPPSQIRRASKQEA